MVTHPCISGPGNVTQIIGHLRRNFPAIVNSDTVKKYGLASNNESYVINALQFIGIIDEDSKRTDRGHQILLLSDGEFESSFSEAIETAYSDLFDLRGDAAWELSRKDLIAFFRTADKTSEVIAGRQAGLFECFRSICGRQILDGSSRKAERITSKPKSKALTNQAKLTTKPAETKERGSDDNVATLFEKTTKDSRQFALTVLK